MPGCDIPHCDGTQAAFFRHYRKGETICKESKAANAAWHRKFYHKRKIKNPEAHQRKREKDNRRNKRQSQIKSGKGTLGDRLKELKRKS